MAKPKHFYYKFERIPALNNEPIRVSVSKHVTVDGPAESTYDVYGGGDSDLLCDCPSSRYRAVGGRCKHVEWTEEWIGLQERTSGQTQFYFSTEDERFIPITNH